jgi:transcription antitermination factor NusG
VCSEDLLASAAVSIEKENCLHRLGLSLLTAKRNRNDAAVMSSTALGQWYLVSSKPHQEDVAQFQMEHKSIDVFLPRLFVPLSKRSKIVPFFPNYLFAHIKNNTEYDQVRWLPGVKCIVDFNGVPAPVNEELIQFLKRCATPSGILTAHSLLAQAARAGLARIIHERSEERKICRESFLATRKFKRKETIAANGREKQESK